MRTSLGVVMRIVIELSCWPDTKSRVFQQPASARARPAARLLHGARVCREHGAAVRPLLEGVEPSHQPAVARYPQDGAGIRAGCGRGDAHHVRPVAPRVVGLLVAYEDWPLLGVLFGAGAMAGDSAKSFFKRRLGVEPGRPWIPFDQLDFVLGALVLVAPRALAWADVVTILLLSFCGHIQIGRASCRERVWV